jgi:hypothetical protein
MPYTPHHKRKPEKPHRDWHDNATLWVAIAGVTVVAVATGVSLWTGFLMREQLAAMRDQQRVMESQQRPWIAVNRIDPFRAASGVAFREGKVSVAYHITVENVGQGLATGVFATANLILADPTGKVEYDISQDTSCDGEDGFPAGLMGSVIGQTVAPGQTLQFFDTETIDIIPDRIQKLPDREYISPFLTGCISYQFLVSPERHQTRFTYRIEARDGGDLITVGQDVPQDQVSYTRAFFGNSYAD